MSTVDIIFIIFWYALFGNGILYMIKDENKAPKNTFYKIIGIAGFPIIIFVYSIVSLFDTRFK